MESQFSHTQSHSSLSSAATIGLNEIEQSELVNYSSGDDDEEMELDDMELEFNNNKEEFIGTSSATHKSLVTATTDVHSIPTAAKFEKFLHVSPINPTPQPVLKKHFEDLLKQKNFPQNERASHSATISNKQKHRYQNILCLSQETELGGSLQKLNEIRSNKNEQAQLRDEIQELLSKFQEAKLLHNNSKRKLENATAIANEERKLAIKEDQKINRKLQKLEARETKWMNTYRASSRTLGDILKTNKRQNQLVESLGVKIFVSSDDSEADEILVRLSKIDPKNPESLFNIRLQTMDVATKTFQVKNMHPTFPEASDVIIKANNHQDFVRFLLDCQKYWLKSLQTSSTPENAMIISENPNDLTKPFFDSPPTPP